MAGTLFPDEVGEHPTGIGSPSCCGSCRSREFDRLLAAIRPSGFDVRLIAATKPATLAGMVAERGVPQAEPSTIELNVLFRWPLPPLRRAGRGTIPPAGALSFLVAGTRPPSSTKPIRTIPGKRS